MYRILIVEDDRAIAEAISAQLAQWEMEVRCVEDFHGVLQEVQAYSPHLILLDVGLPAFNGYHWCREIRKGSSVPIVFISSVADNMSIVMAMNMGADDFIAKPFDQRVLVAKLQAILRRAYDFGASSEVISHRGAALDLGKNALSVDGRPVELSKNEYRVLLALMKNRGRVVSRERLMDDLWATDSFVDDNTLTVNVGRLRKKLEAAGLEDFIRTKFGVGYYIE